jgi:hypothetical protein
VKRGDLDGAKVGDARRTRGATAPLRRALRAAARGLALALGLALAGPLAIAVAPRPAHAQTALDAQSAIDITQGVIDRASGTLRCPPGDEGLACTYFSQAVSLQASARASFASGFLRDAVALTIRARDRVYSALRVGQDATGGEFVRFSIERTDALLDRVAPPVRESGIEQAKRLLDVAFDLENRARAASDGGRPRLALTLTFQARDRTLAALRLADSAAMASPERAGSLLDRTDDFLRAEAWLADAGASADPYARSLELETRARARLAAGDGRHAIELSLQSRDALARAFSKADHAIGRAVVERELSDNATALESARAGAPDDPTAKDRIARAEEHHRQAQEHFREGRFALALAELRASREALNHPGR